MQAQDSEGQMRELIAALQEDTGAVDVKRTIPADVTVTEYELSGSSCRSDLMEIICIWMP